MIRDMQKIMIAFILICLNCWAGFPPHNHETVNTGMVKRGQGLYQALKNVGIGNDQALAIINALRDEVEFSKLKVGDRLKAWFNQQGELKKFSFAQNPAESHVVTRMDGKWVYSFTQEKTHWHTRLIEGELKAGATLQGQLLSQDLSAKTVNEIISALMCKVNFRMNARNGDQFAALVQQRKFQDEVIESKVLYTFYQGRRTGRHETFQYIDDEKGSTYNSHYTEDGQALVRSGLRYPLSSLHVRSGYGMRRHPVTGRRTMHRGVDLRGSRGKAVHAVAAGKVVESTYNKFAGNKIAIRHRDGSTSYYMHLHKRRVSKGAWVRSYQVIGTVGATGRVTGPHLHFGFRKPSGRWMNPLNKRMIATPKLKGERLAKLKDQIQVIKHLLLDMKLSEESHYLLARIPNLERVQRFSWPRLKDLIGDDLSFNADQSQPKDYSL
jgi:murein DD-endopeptidase MepM/ murein hydrolase activator NlpD